MVSIRPKFNSNCPSEIEVLDSISGKWAAVVVNSLNKKPLRNKELKREVKGISDKVLTHTLRKLERDGIVNRKVYPVVPPQVEYSLTKLGKSLVAVLSNIYKWAIDHHDEVLKSRQAYDNLKAKV